DRAAIEIGCHAARLPQDQQRPGEIEGAHRGRRELKGDATGRRMAEVQRGRAELADLLGFRQDCCRPPSGVGAGRRIDLDQGDGAAVEGRYRGAERLTLVKGAPARERMELLAAYQILHVAEPNIPKSVTLRDGQYDGIVWQPHL